MYRVSNLTEFNSGLANLKGKYILTKNKEVADALIISKSNFTGLNITNSLEAIVFVDEPDTGMIDALTRRGIVVLKADLNDLSKNLIEFFENGNLIDCYNFDDINIGNNENIRLSFIVRDFEDPLSKLLDILSVIIINPLKINTTRRDDGISYVLLETKAKDLGHITFEGEDGSKIIKYRMIEK